jgi:hexosaminidase
LETTLLLAAVLHAQNLMPLPAKMTVGQGRFRIAGAPRVKVSGFADARLRAAADRLASLLAKQQTASRSGGPLTALKVVAERAGDRDESYRLSVTPNGATLHARETIGALRGMATFAQLVETGPDALSAPAIEIEDSPRFAWRGLMIDSARHWMPIEVIQRNLDGMAAVKLNVFHWHLSDDQGFRVESRRYPKLHELGSDGHFYTQSQVRDIIAYARERGIRVVPEFDIPGHNTSWLVGYPELAAAPGPYQIIRSWGTMDEIAKGPAKEHPGCLDPTKDEVYTFLDGFIAEMAALFPGPYFHIGGDEVNPVQWNANPSIREFMRAHNLADGAALQAYFSGRVQQIVGKHGKKVIGWEEVMGPSSPPDLVVQGWRGQRALVQAVSRGFNAILSGGYYLDLVLSTAQHYAVDPDAGSSLTPEQKRRILGGEACMWTELATPENIDGRIWPRMAAIAERLWSPASVKDVDSMYRRMSAVSVHLEAVGLEHRSAWLAMTARLAAGGDVEPVRTLAEVVEPIKRYARNDAFPYTSETPMQRLVDASLPESMRAWEFGKLVDSLLATRSGAEPVRHWLEIWRGNDARLQPVLRNSPVLQEAEPVSSQLAQLSAAAIEALDLIAANRHAAADWMARQKVLLDNAAKPHAEVLLSVVPAMRKLIEAAQ